MNGFHNKVLHIDLEARSFVEETVGDEIVSSYLGGKGLSTHLLLHNSKAGADPLSADNPLIFATGPATNTRVWGSSRYGVYTKSPQTGLYAESYSGGRVAEPMSRTGYDAIVLKGISRDPVYLDIQPGNVRFVDASHIWGKDTYETEDAVRQEIGDKSAGIAVIGPAGENLVRFAVIENNYWRSSGRTGVGAVMGSKKVKGIAFRGDREKSVAHPDLLMDLWRATQAKGKDDPGIDKYRNAGTLQLVPVMNEIGAFPTQYWHSGSYDKWKNLTIDALRGGCQVKLSACPRCFIGCGKRSTVLEGRHKGLEIEGPEYETVFSFGGLCLIDDIREIMYLNDICDRLGMDTITAGNLAGFAIEASNRKAIPDKYAYGDVDGIASLLRKIAAREGIGATLAEGIKHASSEWGLKDLAIHVKGLEPAGYDPRVLRGMGLSYATSDRGACHLRATFYKPELSGMIHPDQVEGKAEMFCEWEDRHAIIDSLILCKFFRDLYQWDELSTMIHALTGMELGKEQLRAMASGILTKVREFNLREGMAKRDEALPRRFFEEELRDSGRLLPESDFDTMMSDYYRTRGWREPDEA